MAVTHSPLHWRRLRSMRGAKVTRVAGTAQAGGAFKHFNIMEPRQLSIQLVIECRTGRGFCGTCMGLAGGISCEQLVRYVRQRTDKATGTPDYALTGFSAPPISSFCALTARTSALSPPWPLAPSDPLTSCCVP
jgi:hypothetical protein